jgi:hypothetical protein
MKKILEFLHLRKESPRDKYIRIGLKTLLFISIFLAGYLTAKLQALFSLT